MGLEGLEAGYSRGERASVAISCMLGFWLDFYNLVIVTFLFGAIQASFKLTLAEAGTISSVTLVGSIFGGIAFGWVGDRIGRKNALLLTLGLFSAGALAAAASWNYGALLVFRFIAGIGLGGEWGAGMVLLNEVWPKERRGVGTTMVQAMAPVGAAASAVVAVYCLTHFGPALGWRLALLSGGAPILLMVYVRLWMPESRLWLAYDAMRRAGTLPLAKRAAQTPLLDMFRGASRRYLLIGTLAWSAYVIGFQCISVFLPTLMMRSLGAPLATVRNVTTATALMGAAVMLLLGWYSDRFGRKFGVVAPTIVSLFGFGAFYVWGGLPYAGSILAWPLFWCHLVWTFGQSSAGMYGSWLSELFIVELRASAVATVYNVGRGAGAISPVLVPLIAAALGGNLLHAMVFGAIGSVVCLMAVAALPETAGRAFAVLEAKERTA